MVAKKIFPQLQMADWAWKATQAALAYGGYKIGAGQVPYNYRKPTAQAPQTTFAQPKYEDILGDIDRINIQGKTMEALHTASGEQMAQQIGMYLMPWTDIAGIGMPSTTGGAPGSHGAKWGAWQGKQSANNPLQVLYNLFGEG